MPYSAPHTLVSDVNVAGVSAKSVFIQGGARVRASGTWNGASVTIRSKFLDGTWHDEVVLTANATQIIDLPDIEPTELQIDTVVGSSAPVITLQIDAMGR